MNAGITTASLLGRLLRELEEEGVDAVLAADIVRMAASHSVMEGVIVAATASDVDAVSV